MLLSAIYRLQFCACYRTIGKISVISIVLSCAVWQSAVNIYNPLFRQQVTVQLQVTELKTDQYNEQTMHRA